MCQGLEDAVVRFHVLFHISAIPEYAKKNARTEKKRAPENSNKKYRPFVTSFDLKQETDLRARLMAPNRSMRAMSI